MPLTASQLVAMLQEQIAEHGVGLAQIEAHGSWLPVTTVKSWHGRTLIGHAPFALFPFHRKG